MALLMVISLAVFILINWIPYALNKKFNARYWVSGIVITVIGPTIGYVAIRIFFHLITNDEQQAYDAYFTGFGLGLLLTLSGIIYILAAIVSTIKKNRHVSR
ncbi:hypothetical protein SAMN04488137_3801 [Fictibacillus solisalsi]|uniref:YesK-like protein n=1 Tax=Fictibacillus solisalsi TaxID=459525 RepID=A0A1G9ZYF4_9BACL|nr:hypothetical protein [Fictibacillus solisalsi]SDN25931.1 hypothetical protein SAMN04488137_3801 [Fictibacillus solisalsi]